MTVLRTLVLSICILFFVCVQSSSAIQFNGPPAEDALLAPQALCPVVDTNDSVQAQQASILCYTNYAREKSGLQPLVENAVLDNSAAIKIRDMVSCQSFDHLVCGKPFASVFQEAGYISTEDSYQIGENLSITSQRVTTRETVNMWLNSPKHRENILNPQWKEMGIYPGFDIKSPLYINSLNMATIGSVANVWVQQFGTVEREEETEDYSDFTPVPESSANKANSSKKAKQKRKAKKYVCKKKVKKKTKRVCKKANSKIMKKKR